MLLLLIGRPLVCHTSASPHVPKNVKLLHYTVNKTYSLRTIYYMRNMFPMPMTQSTINMDLLVSPSSNTALRDYNSSAWATSDDRWHLCNGVELMVHGLPKTLQKVPWKLSSNVSVLKWKRLQHVKVSTCLNSCFQKSQVCRSSDLKFTTPTQPQRCISMNRI